MLIEMYYEFWFKIADLSNSFVSSAFLESTAMTVKDL